MSDQDKKSSLKVVNEIRRTGFTWALCWAVANVCWAGIWWWMGEPETARVFVATAALWLAGSVPLWFWRRH